MSNNKALVSLLFLISIIGVGIASYIFANQSSGSVFGLRTHQISAIDSFYLIDADTDQIIEQISYGETIQVENLQNRNLSLSANRSNGKVSHCNWRLNKKVAKQRDAYPFNIDGSEVFGQYDAYPELREGTHTVEVEPIVQNDEGDLVGPSTTIVFTIAPVVEPPIPSSSSSSSVSETSTTTSSSTSSSSSTEDVSVEDIVSSSSSASSSDESVSGEEEYSSNSSINAILNAPPPVYNISGNGKNG